MDFSHDIETLRTMAEQQTFDRKSVRIDAKGLAVVLTAMTNADGGSVVVGIEDDGTVTGVDRYLTGESRHPSWHGSPFQSSHHPFLAQPEDCQCAA